MSYHEDGRVMVNVEKAELLPALLGDDEEGIDEIENLAEVKDV